MIKLNAIKLQDEIIQLVLALISKHRYLGSTRDRNKPVFRKSGYC